MDVCVLSDDPLFFRAVEGVSGAMGHVARLASSPELIGAPDLLIADLGRCEATAGAIVAAFDGTRTAAFVPQTRPELMAAAHAAGIASVLTRGALPVELPRLLDGYRV